MSPPREPTQTISDGRQLLGEIYAEGSTFTATEGDGVVLGEFASIEAARSCIIEHRMAQRREESRS